MLSHSYEEILRYNQEITNVLIECSTYDWDGYGSKPIHPGAISKMQALIHELPAEIVLPNPIPMSDGYLDLEWRSEDMSFIVGLDEDDRFIWAQITRDGQKAYSEVSVSLKEMIEKLKEAFINRKQIDPVAA